MLKSLNVRTKGKWTFVSEINFWEVCKRNRKSHSGGVILSSELAAFDDVKKFVGTLECFYNWIQTIDVDASYPSDGLRSLPMSLLDSDDCPPDEQFKLICTVVPCSLFNARNRNCLRVHELF